MAAHTTNGTPLTMAVYVVGISGNCSNSYAGCGKSCLCRQFMYNEYAEESYSTLLQAEFDSCVIGRQNVIYWGQREDTYLATYPAKVNYEVFEHTILYQDASGLPFTGKPYNQQIFTPLSKFLNKLSFKSRDLILSPEEYEVKTFSYIYKVPVAYLYVVDVSQSCPVFMKQLELMNNLVKSIKKKKGHCVIVASQYDISNSTNIENLEMWANALGIDVIQCSAKHNINVDNAFKYLATKVFSRQLKEFSFSVKTYAEVAVERRRAISTKSSDNSSVYINTIPHIELRNERSDSSPTTQMVHSGLPMTLASLAIAREIKNSNLSLELPSKASAAFYSTDDDDNDDDEFSRDAIDKKPKICTDKTDCRCEDSLNSDFDDECAEPETEYSFRVKRSASFRKAMFNSFKDSFVNRAPVNCSSSSEDFLVIANNHVENLNLIENTRQSPLNNLNIQHSQLSNGISKKKTCSNPK